MNGWMEVLMAAGPIPGSHATPTGQILGIAFVLWLGWFLLFSDRAMVRAAIDRRFGIVQLIVWGVVILVGYSLLSGTGAANTAAPVVNTALKTGGDTLQQFAGKVNGDSLLVLGAIGAGIWVLSNNKPARKDRRGR